MQWYLLLIFSLIAFFYVIHLGMLELIPERVVPPGMANHFRFSETLPRWALINMTLFGSIAGYKLGFSTILFLGLSGMVLGALVGYASFRAVPQHIARVFQIGWVALPVLSSLLWLVFFLRT
jgi:hypothetical protein